MTERISNGYQVLFEVRLLHHYWLDDGAVIYDQMTQARRDSRLLKYDRRRFLSVAPTLKAARDLVAYGCLFRDTALGFVVVVQSAASIPANLTFEFVISVDDGQFFDYTALTLRRQMVYEFFNATDKPPDRYKEGVPVVSNMTGAARAGASKSLFLSQDYAAPVADDPIESLVLSGTAVEQLTSDNPAATSVQVGAQAAQFPVYLNQADVPAIVPPAGITGVPARGIALSPDIPDEVFVLMRLTAVRGSDDDFSFVDGAGLPKAVAPIFQLRFKNRLTVWRYLNKSSGVVLSTEAKPLPLTYFGNAGSKQKPFDGFVKAEITGAKISRLLSDIYV